MSSAIYLGNTLVNGYFDTDSILAFQNKPPLDIDWLLIGGGGSGGSSGGDPAGGGGAGRFVNSSISIQPQSIDIIIGGGGAGVVSSVFGTPRGNTGGTSYITIDGTQYSAPGGGGGGSIGNPNRNALSGGSGGGGGNATSDTPANGGSAIAGSPIAGYGADGQTSPANSAFPEYASFGGGAAGINGDPQGRQWLDGNLYSSGGGPSVYNYTSTGFDRGVQQNNPGDGSGGAPWTPAQSPIASDAGQNGICIIRYFGQPRATGGTITQSSGYTYHTFNSNGTFTY